MFTSTSKGVYQSSLLCAVPAVVHGFGTRRADGWPGEYTAVKQIHSNVVVAAEGSSGVICPGDALVTDERGQQIGIRTADCVPILIADSQQPVVAAIHAGWRGTADEITAATVEKMTASYGSDPANLVAAIGPCIGPCCFEVGLEVAERFQQTSKTVDLAEANHHQLLRKGLKPAFIDISRLCTKCNPLEFHSFRRNRDLSGRMVSAIQIL